MASLEGISLVFGRSGCWGWIGVAPDGSTLALRDKAGPTEVYALDVEWP